MKVYNTQNHWALDFVNSLELEITFRKMNLLPSSGDVREDASVVQLFGIPDDGQSTQTN
jgi:hypothetical protein